jgi:hypothetical protein
LFKWKSGDSVRYENRSKRENFSPRIRILTAAPSFLNARPIGETHSSLTRCSELVYRVTVMLRRTAIRSEIGGCVLNKPENTWPALKGATMNKEAVAGETSMGIRLL